MYILGAVLVMLSISLVLGTLIAVFAKVFEVKMDPRITEITNILPAFNCGGCGYPGCEQYAIAIVEHNAHINLCTPGGAETPKKIQALLVKEFEQKQAEKSQA